MRYCYHLLAVVLLSLRTMDVAAQMPPSCITYILGSGQQFPAGGFVQTADGGFIGLASALSGDGDAVLYRLDPQGELLWAKIVDSGGTNSGRGSVMALPSGGWTMASELVLNGLWSIYIAEFSADGAVVWAKTYSTDVTLSTEWESATRLPDGGYAVYARHTGNSYRAYVLRTDAQGEVVWSNAFTTAFNAHARGMTHTPDGHLILTVESGSETDAVVCMDDDGAILWQNRYSVDGNLLIPVSATVGADGTIVVVGNAACIEPCFGQNGDMFALALDTDGDPQWLTAVGGVTHDHAYVATPALDGGYLLGGQSEPNVPRLTVAKLNAEGTLEWCKARDAAEFGFFYAASTAADGDVLLQGTNDGYRTLFVKAGADGTFCADCGFTDYGVAEYATEPIEKIPMSMPIIGPWAIESPITLTLTDMTQQVFAEVCGPTAIEELSDDELQVRPNPFTSSTRITLPAGWSAARAHLRVHDTVGRCVHVQPVISEQVDLQRGALAAGAYRIVVSAGDGRQVARTVVME